VVDDGEKNENDVMSDMELVSLDVVALLKDPDYEFDFKGEGVTLERFTERFTDVVTGVAIKVDLRVPYTADRCQVPQSGLDVGSTSPCLPVTIYESDGTTVNTTVVSGGSYTLPAVVVCDDATVENSDQTYSNTVAAGGTLVLPDITYRVYVNGELISTTTNPAQSDYTINITD